MNKDIFVIIGQTGEYSDRDEWTVCYLDNEEQAKKYVELATRSAKEIEALCPNDNGCEALTMYGNPYDADMQLDYTGTYYSYRKVPYVSEVKELELIKK